MVKTLIASSIEELDTIAVTSKGWSVTLRDPPLSQSPYLVAYLLNRFLNMIYFATNCFIEALKDFIWSAIIELVSMALRMAIEDQAGDLDSNCSWFHRSH